MAGDQMGGDDHGHVDVELAVAQVEAGAPSILRHAHHPGFAETPTAAEDEHVGP